MLGLFRKAREPFDFAQIVGSCTPDGRKAGASWDNINLADGSNEEAQKLALYFIDFHKKLLGIPYMNGLLEPSASMANFRALELARDTTGKDKVLCTNLSHISIARACGSLGLEPIILDVNPISHQVSDEQVAKAISEHGKNIAAIVSTYGTTQLGHIERLAENESVKQLRCEGAWLHVDTAYGGYIGKLLRYKTRIPDADSITIDPYKFVGKPGVALLLVDANKIPLQTNIYYDNSQHVVSTTLSAGPIAAWGQTVRDIGDICGLREIAQDCVRIAKQLGTELQRQGVSLVRFPEMSIVPVALSSQEEADYVRKELNKRGFKVAKVCICGKDYEVNGIRVVVTPKVNSDLIYSTASQLVKEIIKLAA